MMAVSTVTGNEPGRKMKTLISDENNTRNPEAVHALENPRKRFAFHPQPAQSSNWGSVGERINKLDVLSSKTINVGDTRSRQNLVALGYTNQHQVLCCRSVKLNGVEFRKGLFVVLETSSKRIDRLTLFGRIEEIIVLRNDEVYLLTSVCNTLCFDADVNAYCVQPNSTGNNEKFLEPSTLPYYKPLCYWKKPISEALYISLRHMTLF